MSNFRKNEDGATLVFVGVCLAALMGFAALTFDLGRVAATQSDMQAYADHVALAAAGELDGKPDAIIRALAAAQELIDEERQFFADGSGALTFNADIGVNNLRFIDFEDYPTDDNTPITQYTTDPARASMVEVTTVPRTVFLPFFRAFAVLSGGQARDGTVGGYAVAGYTEYACDIAVMMFCMPQDESLLSTGSSLRVRTGGSNGGWAAGNFGFLNPLGKNGTVFENSAISPTCASYNDSDLYACLIATSSTRNRCFAKRGVNMNTGQAVGVENAVFNTRFDMYNSTAGKYKTDENFAPARHRATGLVSATGNGNGQGNVCLGQNVEDSENSTAFPPDSCHFDTNGCGAFGGKNWDRQGYAQKNYGTNFQGMADQLEALDTTDQFDPLNAGQATRYEVYLREHAAAVTANSNGLPSGNSDETGLVCSNADPVEDPNRRVFVIAGVNCDPDNGGTKITGNEQNVPVDQYYETFLMRPVGTGNGGPDGFDMFLEMIGKVGGDGAGNSDDGGIFREVVELYR